jgi:hypothetical protein
MKFLEVPDLARIRTFQNQGYSEPILRFRPFSDKCEERRVC